MPLAFRRNYRLEDLPPRMREQAERQLGIRPKTSVPASAPAPKPVKADSPRPVRMKGHEIPSGARVPAVRPPITESDFSPAAIVSPSEPPVSTARAVKMTAPERSFLRDVLHGQGWFEPITLVLPGGSRYTPDFLFMAPDGVPCLVETKGGFRLQSEGRAHTAFFEAAARFSSIFRFYWAVREKGGVWNVRHLVERTSPAPSSATSTPSTPSTPSPSHDQENPQ